MQEKSQRRCINSTEATAMIVLIFRNAITARWYLRTADNHRVSGSPNEFASLGDARSWCIERGMLPRLANRLNHF